MDEIEAGDEVTYTGCSDAQAHFGTCSDPREHLEVGKEYTVSYVDVHSWHTSVSLEGFPYKGFNSVCFE